MKSTILVLVILFVAAVGAYFTYSSNSSQVPANNSNLNMATATSAPMATQPVPVPGVPVSNVSVSIKNFAFSPATLDIKTGAKVTWTNNDTAPHTVTSDSGNFLNSPTLSAGQSYSVIFTSPGSMNYHCAIHPAMKGVVTATN